MSQNTLAVFFDDRFTDHEHPPGAYKYASDDLLAEDEPHPERPVRVRNIRRAIERELDDVTTWPTVSPATRDQLERVHSPDYLDELVALSAEPGSKRITETTTISEGTYEIARYAAGATVGAATHALDTDEVGYALVRPPGHHAQPTMADGFCYLNNVGVAAEEALTRPDVERVAVVDWDVHPGNGTQECFYDRDDVLVVSLHNDFGVWGPNHPQTNGLEEQGTGSGEGYSVNVPLPPGTGDAGYAFAFEELVEPIVEEFAPDLLLVSAGQDPGQLDPLGRNLVTKGGFADLGRRVRTLAEGAGADLALVQEGGYQQSHLAYATLGALEGAIGYETGIDDPMDMLDEYEPPAREWVAEAVDAYAPYWSV